MLSHRCRDSNKSNVTVGLNRECGGVVNWASDTYLWSFHIENLISVMDSRGPSTAAETYSLHDELMQALQPWYALWTETRLLVGIYVESSTAVTLAMHSIRLHGSEKKHHRRMAIIILAEIP